MKKLTKFEKIFIKVVKAYVKYYQNHSFKFYFDDFEYPQIGDSEKVIEVKFKNSENAFNRIFREGSLGFGESYCSGNIEVADEDFKHFLIIFVRVLSNRKVLFSLSLFDMIRVAKAKLARPFFTRGNQKENINSHYSLRDWFDNDEDSNEFYLYWLNSPYIQYSCGKWDEDAKTLEEAQNNKFEFYAKRFGIDENSKGKTMLDLGCGWGGFIFYFAEKHGLKCKGLTLSTAQTSYINSEIKKRGLEKNVDVEIKNIHNMTGSWDYIISVGVLEHIDDYDDLYQKTAACLKENGRALLHTIYHTVLFHKADPFITKYIFPGVGTPNMRENLKILRKYFKNVDKNDLPALSYPKTLACWFDNYCKNEDKIRNLLATKSKCENVEYCIKIFKYYLTASCCTLTEHSTVSNVLVSNFKILCEKTIE